MKQRATLYLDGDLWRDFRSACVKRGVSASYLVNILIHEQMSAWMGDPIDQKDTDQDTRTDAQLDKGTTRGDAEGTRKG